MRTKFLSLIAGILFASLLAGCGGSSSSGQSVSTGVYKDAGIVSGLQYATPTQSGVTDSNGKFKYVAGETVTFSVSNVTIGQATGAPIVTTFDLVGIAPPTSSFGIPTNNPMSKRFQEAINISLFLQTLDDDSDPSNGIAIPAVVNSVVAANPLNFKFNNYYAVYGLLESFQDSPQFKVFIGSCRAAGAWGGIKAIKRLGYAANSLYQGLGLTPSVYLEDKTTYNLGNFTKFEYTNSGLKFKELEYDNSNSLISQTTYTYDPNGNLTSRVHVYGANLGNTITHTYAYDANGNQIALTRTAPEGTENSVYEYDINGNLTKRTWYSDGNISSTKTQFNAYNANGTLATEKSYNANNELTESSSYTYNDNLLLTFSTWTNGFDQSSLAVEYDKNNNFTKFTHTYSNNYVGTENFTYDLFGNIVTDIVYSDGVLSGSDILTWDSNGYPVTRKSYDANGQLIYSTVAAYDGNGSRTSMVTKYGVFTDTTTYTYIGQSVWGGLLGMYSHLFF